MDWLFSTEGSGVMFEFPASNNQEKYKAYLFVLKLEYKKGPKK